MRYIKLFERFENVFFKGEDIKKFSGEQQLFFYTLKFHIGDYVRKLPNNRDLLDRNTPNVVFIIDALDLADRIYPYHIVNITDDMDKIFVKESELILLKDYEVSAIKYNL